MENLHPRVAERYEAMFSNAGLRCKADAEAIPVDEAWLKTNKIITEEDEPEVGINPEDVNAIVNAFTKKQ